MAWFVAITTASAPLTESKIKLADVYWTLPALIFSTNGSYATTLAPNRWNIFNKSKLGLLRVSLTPPLYARPQSATFTFRGFFFNFRNVLNNLSTVCFGIPLFKTSAAETIRNGKTAFFAL